MSSRNASELAQARWRSPAGIDRRVDALARLIRERLATMPPLSPAHFDRLNNALVESIVPDRAAWENW